MASFKVYLVLFALLVIVALTFVSAFPEDDLEPAESAQYRRGGGYGGYGGGRYGGGRYGGGRYGGGRYGGGRYGGGRYGGRRG